MPGEVLRITLPPAVVAEVTKRASTCGLAPSLFVRQLVEAYVADARCTHGVARPEAPEPEIPADDP